MKEQILFLLDSSEKDYVDSQWIRHVAELCQDGDPESFWLNLEKQRGCAAFDALIKFVSQPSSRVFVECQLFHSNSTSTASVALDFAEHSSAATLTEIVATFFEALKSKQQCDETESCGDHVVECLNRACTSSRQSFDDYGYRHVVLVTSMACYGRVSSKLRPWMHSRNAEDKVNIHLATFDDRATEGVSESTKGMDIIFIPELIDDLRRSDHNGDAVQCSSFSSDLNREQIQLCVHLNDSKVSTSRLQQIGTFMLAGKDGASQSLRSHRLSSDNNNIFALVLRSSVVSCACVASNADCSKQQRIVNYVDACSSSHNMFDPTNEEEQHSCKNCLRSEQSSDDLRLIANKIQRVIEENREKCQCDGVDCLVLTPFQLTSPNGFHLPELDRWRQVLEAGFGDVLVDIVSPNLPTVPGVLSLFSNGDKSPCLWLLPSSVQFDILQHEAPTERYSHSLCSTVDNDHEPGVCLNSVSKTTAEREPTDFSHAFLPTSEEAVLPVEKRLAISHDHELGKDHAINETYELSVVNDIDMASSLDSRPESPVMKSMFAKRPKINSFLSKVQFGVSEEYKSTVTSPKKKAPAAVVRCENVGTGRSSRTESSMSYVSAVNGAHDDAVWKSPEHEPPCPAEAGHVEDPSSPSNFNPDPAVTFSLAGDEDTIDANGALYVDKNGWRSSVDSPFDLETNDTAPTERHSDETTRDGVPCSENGKLDFFGESGIHSPNKLDSVLKSSGPSTCEGTPAKGDQRSVISKVARIISEGSPMKAACPVDEQRRLKVLQAWVQAQLEAHKEKHGELVATPMKAAANGQPQKVRKVSRSSRQEQDDISFSQSQRSSRMSTSSQGSVPKVRRIQTVTVSGFPRTFSCSQIVASKDLDQGQNIRGKKYSREQCANFPLEQLTKDSEMKMRSRKQAGHGKSMSGLPRVSTVTGFPATTTAQSKPTLTRTDSVGSISARQDSKPKPSVAKKSSSIDALEIEISSDDKIDLGSGSREEMDRKFQEGYRQEVMSSARSALQSVLILKLSVEDYFKAHTMGRLVECYFEEYLNQRILMSSDNLLVDTMDEDETTLAPYRTKELKMQILFHLVSLKCSGKDDATGNVYKQTWNLVKKTFFMVDHYIAKSFMTNDVLNSFCSDIPKTLIALYDELMLDLPPELTEHVQDETENNNSMLAASTTCNDSMNISMATSPDFPKTEHKSKDHNGTRKQPVKTLAENRRFRGGVDVSRKHGAKSGTPSTDEQPKTAKTSGAERLSHPTKARKSNLKISYQRGIIIDSAVPQPLQRQKSITAKNHGKSDNRANGEHKRGTKEGSRGRHDIDDPSNGRALKRPRTPPLFRGNGRDTARNAKVAKRAVPETPESQQLSASERRKRRSQAEACTPREGDVVPETPMKGLMGDDDELDDDGSAGSPALGKRGDRALNERIKLQRTGSGPNSWRCTERSRSPIMSRSASRNPARVQALLSAAKRRGVNKTGKGSVSPARKNSTMDSSPGSSKKKPSASKFRKERKGSSGAKSGERGGCESYQVLRSTGSPGEMAISLKRIMNPDDTEDAAKERIVSGRLRSSTKESSAVKKEPTLKRSAIKCGIFDIPRKGPSGVDRVKKNLFSRSFSTSNLEAHEKGSKNLSQRLPSSPGNFALPAKAVTPKSVASHSARTFSRRSSNIFADKESQKTMYRSESMACLPSTSTSRCPPSTATGVGKSLLQRTSSIESNSSSISSKASRRSKHFVIPPSAVQIYQVEMGSIHQEHAEGKLDSVFYRGHQRRCIFDRQSYDVSQTKKSDTPGSPKKTDRPSYRYKKLNCSRSSVRSYSHVANFLLNIDNPDQFKPVKPGEIKSDFHLERVFFRQRYYPRLKRIKIQKVKGSKGLDPADKTHAPDDATPSPRYPGTLSSDANGSLDSSRDVTQSDTDQDANPKFDWRRSLYQCQLIPRDPRIVLSVEKPVQFGRAVCDSGEETSNHGLPNDLSHLKPLSVSCCSQDSGPSSSEPLTGSSGVGTSSRYLRTGSKRCRGKSPMSNSLSSEFHDPEGPMPPDAKRKKLHCSDSTEDSVISPRSSIRLKISLPAAKNSVQTEIENNNRSDTVENVFDDSEAESSHSETFLSHDADSGGVGAPVSPSASARPAAARHHHTWHPTLASEDTLSAEDVQAALSQNSSKAFLTSDLMPPKGIFQLTCSPIITAKVPKVQRPPR